MGRCLCWLWWLRWLAGGRWGGVRAVCEGGKQGKGMLPPLQAAAAAELGYDKLPARPAHSLLAWCRRRVSGQRRSTRLLWPLPGSTEWGTSGGSLPPTSPSASATSAAHTTGAAAAAAAARDRQCVVCCAAGAALLAGEFNRYVLFASVPAHQTALVAGPCRWMLHACREVIIPQGLVIDKRFRMTRGGKATYVG